MNPTMQRGLNIIGSKNNQLKLDPFREKMKCPLIKTRLAALWLPTPLPGNCMNVFYNVKQLKEIDDKSKHLLVWWSAI
jgi:hypothetical protein